jgi:hypothetical protein
MWGAIASAAAQGIGSGLEAWGAMDATKDYNAQMRKLNEEAKQWNYARFLESRGSGGQALLPTYFPKSTETNLSNNALAEYAAMQSAAGTPDQELASYQAAANAMIPGQTGAEVAVNNLFSGRMADQQVANIAPVQAARGAVAKAQKTGILEGLQARLNALSADRARAGYVGGGSTFQKNLLTGATIPALQQAATVGAQADLANATDEANIRNTALNTQLQDVNLPGQVALNRMQMTQAPQTAAEAAQAGRMGLFNWFKMPIQSYSWNQVPEQQLTPNLMMVAGAGLKGSGQGLGSMMPGQSTGSSVSTANQGSTSIGFN